MIDFAITEVTTMTQLWDHVLKCKNTFEVWLPKLWDEIDCDEMDLDCKRLIRTLKHDIKVDKNCNAYCGLRDELKSWLIFIPMVMNLHSHNMRERHWDAILTLANLDFNYQDCKFALKDVYELNLVKYCD